MLGSVCNGVCMWLGVCLCYVNKTKTPDRNDMQVGTVIDLDAMSKPIDFGFKRSRVRVRVMESATNCISRWCIFLPVRA